jgi:hypothetical protein
MRRLWTVAPSSTAQLLLVSDNGAAADHYRRTDNRVPFRVGEGRTAAVSIPGCTWNWGFLFADEVNTMAPLKLERIKPL